MLRALLLLAFLLPLVACGDSDTSAPDGSIAGAAEAIQPLPASRAPEAGSGATVAGQVAGAADLTTLQALLRETGLNTQLEAEGPFTLFAPSDEAFAAIDLDAARSDTDALRSLLLAHVLPFRTLSADMDFEQSVETVNGTMLDVQPGTPPAVASGGVRAGVVRADLDAANGVVHVIDAVLLPAN